MAGIIGKALQGSKVRMNTDRQRPSEGMARIGGGMFDHYKSDAYASVFPNVRAISNEFMTIRPFAIDGNGKEVAHEAVQALYHPNQADSSVAFFEKIAVSTLVHPKTYILVWRKENGKAEPGGDFERLGKNIAGYTFLEYPGVTRRDGRTYYNIGAQEFNDKEVMVLPGGVDPFNLYGGYSPSEASRRWATLDDYIADYQAGFFENGAVPSGQFIITAVSDTDFNDTVDLLQAKHRGSGNNNNVTYTPRPRGQDGKPADAKIEWIPFASSNKDIDFKNLFEQANKRIDRAYGVPQIVQGVDDAATYANAQVADAGFSKRAVYPLALRDYTQITHELNRITGGLGVAISFKYEIPKIADAEKVEAETKQIEVTAILALTDKGYSLDTAVDALQLSNSYKLLKTGTGAAKIDNPKPDVDKNGEVETSPDPEEIDGVTPLNKKKVSLTSELPSKKHVHGGGENTNPKAETDEQLQIEAVARQFMQSQIDRAVDQLPDDEPSNEAGDPTQDEQDTFVDDMLVIIVSIMIAQGAIEYEAGKSMIAEAGLSTENLDKFILSDTAQTAYQSYLKKVGQSYGQDTAVAIQTVLQRATDEGLNRKETEAALKDILNTDEWRIKRLGVTELNRSQSLSGVEAMKQIEAETGATIEKSLDHPNGAVCEWCKALEDVWVKVTEDYIPLYGIVVGVDGGILINDFVANEGYDPHPNGKGVMIYRVVVDSASNSVVRELHCSACDRFLGETMSETVTDKLKCPNSKCKALAIPLIKEKSNE